MTLQLFEKSSAIHAYTPFVSEPSKLVQLILHFLFLASIAYYNKHYSITDPHCFSWKLAGWQSKIRSGYYMQGSFNSLGLRCI